MLLLLTTRLAVARDADAGEAARSRHHSDDLDARATPSRWCRAG